MDKGLVRIRTNKNDKQVLFIPHIYSNLFLDCYNFISGQVIERIWVNTTQLEPDVLLLINPSFSFYEK